MAFSVEGANVRRLLSAPEGTRALFVNMNELPDSLAAFKAMAPADIPYCVKTVMMFAVVSDETHGESIVPCVATDIFDGCDGPGFSVVPVAAGHRPWPEYLGCYGPGCTPPTKDSLEEKLSLAQVFISRNWPFAIDAKTEVRPAE